MKKCSVLFALICMFCSGNAYADELMDKLYKASEKVSDEYATCAAFHIIRAKQSKGNEVAENNVLAFGYMTLAKQFGNAGQKK